MKLVELMGITSEDTKIRVFTKGGDEKIATYDGRDSIPFCLDRVEVFEIEAGSDSLFVYLNADDRESLTEELTKTLLRSCLEDLDGGEDVGNVLARLHEEVNDIYSVFNG